MVTRGGQSTDHDGQTQQVCSPERRAQALTALSCARQASVKEQQRHTLAAEREAGIATGKAKQQVMDTMSHLPISSI